MLPIKSDNSFYQNLANIYLSNQLHLLDYPQYIMYGANYSQEIPV